MNPRRLACLTLVLLAACGGASWDKPGATQDVVQKDGEECWDKARTQARSYTAPASGGVMVGSPAARERRLVGRSARRPPGRPRDGRGRRVPGVHARQGLQREALKLLFTIL